MIERAWAAEDDLGCSWWDALIVAAAPTCGADYLLTEDLQEGRHLGSLRIISPFEHAAASILGDPRAATP